MILATQRRKRSSAGQPSRTGSAPRRESESDIRDRLYAEQIRQLYRQSAVSLIAAPIISFVLLVVLRGQVDDWMLVHWFLLVVVVTAGKYMLVRRYQQAPKPEADARRWGRLHIECNLLSGLLWGAAALWLFPGESSAHQYFLALMIGGMVAGATTAYAALLPSYVAYSLPALAPLAVRFFFSGGELQSAVGVSLVVYQALVLNNAKLANRAMVFTLRLGLQNELLVERLGSEKQHLEALNAEHTAEIAERKRAQQSASTRRQYLEAILQSTPAATITLDANQCVLEWNAGAERLFGYQAAESRHQPLEDLLFPAVNGKRDQATADVRRRLREGATIDSVETVCRRKDREPVDVIVTAAPIRWGERPVGSVVTCTDISERRQVEEQLHTIQRLKSIGTLAGGIAHDFNNLLTGIYGNLTLAKLEVSLDHPSYAYLEDAEHSMTRATRLTNQLLTFAKGGEPVREYVGLSDLIREVALFDLAGSSVRLIFDQSEDLWTAPVDKGQMQQVFSNLVRNAVQAMPDGGHLYIALSNYRCAEGDPLPVAPGSYVCGTVRDEGVGIEAEHLHRIFEPYFTTKEEGHGLGLSMVYSIIRKHGGHIAVQSTPGQGACFRWYLPAAQQTDLPASEPAVAVPAARSRSARLLVMDDEPSVRRVASGMLEHAGYVVVTACDGEDAVRRYRESLHEGRRFDAVIMDCTIPGGMGAKQTIEELLKLDPDAVGVVSSGYADDPILARYAAYGFRAAAAKPYSLDALLRTVSRALHSCGEPGLTTAGSLVTQAAP